MKMFLYCIPIILFLSCGIEEIRYLDNPPVQDFTSEQSVLRSLEGKILLDVDALYLGSNEGFQGFDVYYKIFSGVENQTTNLAGDNSSLTSTTDGLQPNVSKLLSLGYTKASVWPAGETNPNPTRSSPLIAMEKLSYSTGYRIYFDFSGFILAPQNERSGIIPRVRILPSGADVDDLSIQPLAEWELYRGVTYEDRFRSFGDLFDPERILKGNLEPNISGANNSVITGTDVLEICFFAVAVGYDNLTFENLESTPVPLGIIKGMKVR